MQSFHGAVCADINGHRVEFLRTPEVADRWHEELVKILADVDAQIAGGRRVDQAKTFRGHVYRRLHEARRLVHA